MNVFANGYIGDFLAGSKLSVCFSTFDGTGNPASLSGGSPACQSDSLSATTLGCAIFPDVGGQVGLNVITVDTTAFPGFYGAGHDFTVFLQGGTVGTDSAASAVVGSFSIQNRGGGGGPVQLAADGLDLVLIDGGLNARQTLAILAAALAGVSAGQSTNPASFAAAGNPGTTRIQGTVDHATGDRTAVTLFPSP